ncbi:ATP-binding protein [Microcoleus sp. Pol14C6]|uniref:ATP-binding protein n=1 Tax=unclassified Microcoleus TaxID=2642155 RepID=UPI002FD59E3E
MSGFKSNELPNPTPVLSSNFTKLALQVNLISRLFLRFYGGSSSLEYLPIPEAVLQQFKLAAIEAFTNAVRHAHKNRPSETPIELEITVFNDRLELKIWDWGKPFDLQSKLEEELPETSLFSWKELGFMLD